MACSPELKEGSICPCSVLSLHPTQVNVGEIEVAAKIKKEEFSKMKKAALEEFERKDKNLEPTVIGPNGVLYIIDHHHLARALWESHIASTYCKIAANFSKASEADFWEKMKKKNWVYPYDKGIPVPYVSIPDSVGKLTDDPYRSLAGAVGNEKAFNDSGVLFAEFYWADYFRKHISLKKINDHFKEAVEEAKKIAHCNEAKKLPGYFTDKDLDQHVYCAQPGEQSEGGPVPILSEIAPI